jgi:hypothetical protein
MRSGVALIWVHTANIGAERSIRCAEIRELSAGIIHVNFTNLKEVGSSEIFGRESVDVFANSSEVRVATHTHVRI